MQKNTRCKINEPKLFNCSIKGVIILRFINHNDYDFVIFVGSIQVAIYSVCAIISYSMPLIYSKIAKYL